MLEKLVSIGLFIILILSLAALIVGLCLAAYLGVISYRGIRRLFK